MATQSGNPQCPFCQLVANPEETFTVHETEHFKAWLDINPRARGHTMIVPKDHHTSMEELGEHVPEMFEMVRIVMEKAKNGLDADGVSVAINEGEAAGQNLDHFYVQVFPRFEDEENAGAPTGAVFQYRDDIDESDLPDISSSMEDAPFESSGKPTKDGAATDIVQSNRGSDSGRTQESRSRSRDSQRSSSQRGSRNREDRERGGNESGARHERTTKRNDTDNSEADTADTDEDEDTRKDKKDEDRWDGEDYSWDRDGAEFR